MDDSSRKFLAGAVTTVAPGLSLGIGFLCPNNLLNMYAFMHEKLPKYAHRKSIPNI
jgi:hypothetical protein